MIATSCESSARLPNATPWNWQDALALTALVTLAFGLRLPQLSESLWLDELHTAWTVDANWPTLVARAAQGNASPVYFALIKLSTLLFGLNEFALRLPSLIAGVALVGLIYAVLRRWTGSAAAATLAAFLVAIDPNCLFYSLEARPYALVQLVGLAQLFVFWETLDQPTRLYRGLFVILSALLFYLHYTAILLLVAELLFYLALSFFPRAVAYRWKSLALDLVFIGLLCLPASLALFGIAARRDNWKLFIASPSLADLFRLFPLGIYLLLPSIILTLLLSLRSLRDGKFPRSRMDARLWFFVVIWLCVPLGLVWVATRIDLAPLFLRRYVIVAAIAPQVLAGLMCAQLACRSQRSAFALLVALVAIYWFGSLDHWQTTGKFAARPLADWRAAVKELNAQTAGRDVLLLIRSGLIEADGLLVDPQNASLREFSSLPVRSIYRWKFPQSLIPLPTSRPGKISGDDLQQLAGAREVWLLLHGDIRSKDIALKQLRAELRAQKRSLHVQKTMSFGGAWLLKAEVDSLPQAAESSREAARTTRPLRAEP